MDHAFGFKTDYVKSKAIRYLLSYIVFLFWVFFFVLFLFTYSFFFSFFYFLINHEILFTNFARAEFERMFSFVSLLFIALLSLSIRAEEVYTVWL